MKLRTTKYRCPEPLADESMLSRARYTAPARVSKRAPWALGGGAADAGAHGRSPPLVTRGERGPTLVCRDGKIVEVPARKGYGGSAAFIDWVNVTMGEESFYWGENGVPVTDDQLIVEISIICESIFGFGITGKRDKGANFYHRSWDLGEGMGLICYGGQRDTVLIMLNGEGCGGAKPGWEKRLYEFLGVRAVRPRITRIDLAHDDYHAERYSCDRAISDYDAGLYNCGGRNPDIEQRGNWKAPNGKGRTVYVGNRRNGKFLRVYEKGRQLGCETSEWVRVEGEFKSVDRDLPLDILLVPGAYLAAMYPALAWVQGEQKRIVTRQQEAQFSYKKLMAWLKRQCGAALWFACEMEGGAEALLAKIMREGEFPNAIKGLKDWQTARVPIHKVDRVQIARGQYVQWA